VEWGYAMADEGLVRIYRMPGGTTDQYDKVTAAAGDVVAAGASVHLAGTTDTDLWVVEVWPSAEALAAWQESQAAGRAAQDATFDEVDVIECDLHRFLTAG